MDRREINQAYDLIQDMQDTLRWIRRNTEIKKGTKTTPKLSNPKMDFALSLVHNIILKLEKENKNGN